MASYTGFKGLLKEALGEYAELGFELRELSTELIELYYLNRKVGRYTRAVTFARLRLECQTFLDHVKVWGGDAYKK